MNQPLSYPPRFLATLLALTIVIGPLASVTAHADEMTSTLRPAYGTSSPYTYTNDPYSNTGGYNTSTNTYSQPTYGAAQPTYGPSYTPSYGYSNQTPLQGRVSTIPKGSTLNVKLDQPISSEANRLGETVTGTIVTPTAVDGEVRTPAGGHAQGAVVSVLPTRHIGRHGEVTVRFYEIRTPDGATIPIQGHIVTDDSTGRFRGDSYAMDAVKGTGTAVGGTALGAVGGTAIGGILGVAGAGALMGTGIGAVAGISYALARKGKDVTIPSGTHFNIKVDEDTAANR